MSNQYLLMWLEGPLQAWGFDSKFGRRDTLNFPTKSGILGLLCCALGAGGEQRELLARFESLSQTILAFVRFMSNYNIIKKSYPEPLLRDFHMVGSGYDEYNLWQRLLIPKTNEGKKAVGGGTKITYRYYLQDATFAAIVEIPSDMAEKVAEALQNPVWDLYLGRKNCVPTEFIYQGLFINSDEAIRYATKLAQEKSLIEEFRVEDFHKLDSEEGHEILILNDVPLQFGEQKKYRDRLVKIITA